MESMSLTEEELYKEYDSKSLFEFACEKNAVVIANDKKRDRYKIVAIYSNVNLWWGNLLAIYKDKTGECKKDHHSAAFCKGNYYSSPEKEIFGPKNIIIAECIYK